ncbi:MAG TPA: hypothetical protein VD794_05425 [Flavisolibacter sp.]|nr:hypothetical protein [Flavisolibacter sp.]
MATLKQYNWLAFLIIFTLMLFTSGADLFQSYGSRLQVLGNDLRLIILFTFSDGLTALASGFVAVLFFKLYRHKRDAPYRDIYAQMGLAFACQALLALLNIFGNFTLYQWIVGINRLLVAWFVILLAILFTKYYDIIKNQRTPEELKEAIALKKQLLEKLKEIKQHERNME